jgi:hypothetical protein
MTHKVVPYQLLAFPSMGSQANARKRSEETGRNNTVALNEATSRKSLRTAGLWGSSWRNALPI